MAKILSTPPPLYTDYPKEIKWKEFVDGGPFKSLVDENLYSQGYKYPASMIKAVLTLSLNPAAVSKFFNDSFSRYSKYDYSNFMFLSGLFADLLSTILSGQSSLKFSKLVDIDVDYLFSIYPSASFRSGFLSRLRVGLSAFYQQYLYYMLTRRSYEEELLPTLDDTSIPSIALMQAELLGGELSRLLLDICSSAIDEWNYYPSLNNLLQSRHIVMTTARTNFDGYECPHDVSTDGVGYRMFMYNDQSSALINSTLSGDNVGLDKIVSAVNGSSVSASIDMMLSDFANSSLGTSKLVYPFPSNVNQRSKICPNEYYYDYGPYKAISSLVLDEDPHISDFLTLAPSGYALMNCHTLKKQSLSFPTNVIGDETVVFAIAVFLSSEDTPLITLVQSKSTGLTKTNSDGTLTAIYDYTVVYQHEDGKSGYTDGQKMVSAFLTSLKFSDAFSEDSARTALPIVVYDDVKTWFASETLLEKLGVGVEGAKTRIALLQKVDPSKFVPVTTAAGGSVDYFAYWEEEKLLVTLTRLYDYSFFRYEDFASTLKELSNHTFFVHSVRDFEPNLSSLIIDEFKTQILKIVGEAPTEYQYRYLTRNDIAKQAAIRLRCPLAVVYRDGDDFENLSMSLRRSIQAGEELINRLIFTSLTSFRSWIVTVALSLYSRWFAKLSSSGEGLALLVKPYDIDFFIKFIVKRIKDTVLFKDQAHFSWYEWKYYNWGGRPYVISPEHGAFNAYSPEYTFSSVDSIMTPERLKALYFSDQLAYDEYTGNVKCLDVAVLKGLIITAEQMYEVFSALLKAWSPIRRVLISVSMMFRMPEKEDHYIAAAANIGKAGCCVVYKTAYMNPAIWSNENIVDLFNSKNYFRRRRPITYYGIRQLLLHALTIVSYYAKSHPVNFSGTTCYWNCYSHNASRGRR